MCVNIKCFNYSFFNNILHMYRVFVIRDEEKGKDLKRNVATTPYRSEDLGKEMRRKWQVSCMSMRRNKDKEGKQVHQDRMYVIQTSSMKGTYFWCVNDREILEGDVGTHKILMSKVKLFSVRVNYIIEGVEYMTKDFFVRIGNLSVNNSRREGLIVEIDVRDHDKDKDAHRIEAFASSLGIDTASIKKNTTTSFPNMPSNASRKVWEYMLAMRELS